MYKREKLNTVFKDYIVLRELNPIRKDLPQFKETKKALNLNVLPRKKDVLYAKVLGYIFKSVGNFKKILYLGDTLMSDGSVIRNFVKNGEFKTYGIITRESGDRKMEAGDAFIFSTRWDSLMKAIKKAEEMGVSLDENTVLVVDIDKTAIGARGRNDKAIDKARMDAILQITGDIFGSIDEEKFFKIYNRVNTKDLFRITGDNQDIISAVSILIYSGAADFNMFESVNNAADFLETARTRVKINRLKEITEKVYTNVKNHNPTAFPLFRKTEFLKTIDRMDFLKDESMPEKLLSEEILITGEVFNAALYAKERGALVFGVSDKPALSTMPSGDINLPPIFEKEMKVFGKY